MKKLTKKLSLALVVAGALVLASTARGVTISYFVGGWAQQFPGPVTPPPNAPWGPNGYPGDTVTFAGYGATVDLSPGTNIEKINTLLWSIDYTYAGTATNPNAWSNLAFNFDAPRVIFIDRAVGVVSQPGALKVTWDNDFLSLSGGATTSLVVDGYRIDVTPLGLAEVGGSNFSDGNPWAQPARDVMARFEVAAVPDVANTFTLIGVALLGLRLMRRKIGAA